MSTTDHKLRKPRADGDLFTDHATVARLLDLMAGWWEGRSLADLAKRHGISRQRVRAILMRVGCVENLRGADGRDHPDSSRPAPAARMREAFSMLEHPKVHRLTRRQYGAVAWAALGLTLADIGKRMGITPCGAGRLLAAARARMERTSQRPSAEAGTGSESEIPGDVGLLRWDGLVEGARSVGQSHQPENAPAQPERFIGS